MFKSIHVFAMKLVLLSVAIGFSPRSRAELDRTDFYTILDVAQTATAKEIQKAYRQQALKYHPDTSGRDSAAELGLVMEAYQALRDPAARAIYDEWLRQQAAPHGQRAHSPNEPRISRASWETAISDFTLREVLLQEPAYLKFMTRHASVIFQTAWVKGTGFMSSAPEWKFLLSKERMCQSMFGISALLALSTPWTGSWGALCAASVSAITLGIYGPGTYRNNSRNARELRELLNVGSPEPATLRDRLYEFDLLFSVFEVPSSVDAWAFDGTQLFALFRRIARQAPGFQQAWIYRELKGLRFDDKWTRALRWSIRLHPGTWRAETEALLATLREQQLLTPEMAARASAIFGARVSVSDCESPLTRLTTRSE